MDTRTRPRRPRSTSEPTASTARGDETAAATATAGAACFSSPRAPRRGRAAGYDGAERRRGWTSNHRNRQNRQKSQKSQKSQNRQNRQNRQNHAAARPRSSSLSRAEWLDSSPVLELAYELAQQRKVTTRELARLVASDLLWHTGERARSPITIPAPAAFNNVHSHITTNTNATTAGHATATITARAAAAAAATRRHRRHRRHRAGAAAQAKRRFRRAAVQSLCRRGDFQTFDQPHLGEDGVEAEVSDADFGLTGNLTDPLSLEPLGSTTFLFRHHQAYNVDTLFQYIVSSGVFQDPTTRIEYTDGELGEIDALYRSAGGAFPRTLVQVRAENAGVYAEEKLRASAVDGVENILDGVVAQMRDTVSGAPINGRKKDAYARHLYLVSQVFPQFDHTLGQLFELAPETALRCLKIYTAQVKGPAQRPTKNPHKLLRGVLEFLQTGQKRLENELAKLDAPSHVNPSPMPPPPQPVSPALSL
jgi:hypothetical protein